MPENDPTPDDPGQQEQEEEEETDETIPYGSRDTNETLNTTTLSLMTQNGASFHKNKSFAVTPHHSQFQD